ncbi:hypothetical protein [Burkholderia sp. LMG 21824]|uniref:hypothetical protein n=1 Tax=Burkholderia sp. LMG 21824 TaxID=3158172 RepID=UPI003C2B402C
MTDFRFRHRVPRSSRRATLRQLGSGWAAVRLPVGGTLASRPLTLLDPFDVRLRTRASGAPLLSPPDGAPGPHERDVVRLSTRRCRAVRTQPARKPS